MELGPMLLTIIVLAVALAILAGAWAARLLLHAGETSTSDRRSGR
jgi:hypothetical protein